MAAIAITTTALVFLLVIGLIGLIICTIILIIAVILKKTKLLVIIPVTGIILSLIPFILSLIGISYFRFMINKDEKPIVNTGTKLYWQYENNDKYKEYFIYKGKKYILLTSYAMEQPNSRKPDKPVANIIDYEKNTLSRIFMLTFGIKDNENLLYTIKNYPDDSLLMEDRFGFVYCEEDLFSEKKNYYDNIDNYKYYASYGHLPEENESIELYDREIIKEIYTYSGDLLQRPPEKESNYIFIFGISDDGILLKKIASIIFYNDQLYKEFGFFTEEAEGMALLDKKQSEYINEILIKLLINNKN